MPIHVNNRIGRGGFSHVYEATMPEGKLVALKQSHVINRIEHPMLLHEACVLSFLAGRSQYFEYLVLDLLGTSLADLVKEQKQLTLRTTLMLLDQMLDSLEHLHSHHLIHGDIKPDNFLFGLGDNSERIHLIDFGFARYYRNPISLSHHGLAPNQGFLGALTDS
ncbi:kinase-like protein [Pluteus cervinus]|uniref:Kinase-like protein n=1 Tax=Pluteus cervinus TaxID=181527 RepID=A0ACD3B2N7_9AGAR|nr:kinase-like protein [Pluteus cervinus]